VLKAAGALEEAFAYGMAGWLKAQERNVGPLGCLPIKPPQYWLWALEDICPGIPSNLDKAENCVFIQTPAINSSRSGHPRLVFPLHIAISRSKQRGPSRLSSFRPVMISTSSSCWNISPTGRHDGHLIRVCVSRNIHTLLCTAGIGVSSICSADSKFEPPDCCMHHKPRPWAFEV
jgi:hypothetical protein